MARNPETDDQTTDRAILEIWPDIVRLLHRAGIKHDVPIGRLSVQICQMLRRSFQTRLRDAAALAGFARWLVRWSRLGRLAGVYIRLPLLRLAFGGSLV